MCRHELLDPAVWTVSGLLEPDIEADGECGGIFAGENSFPTFADTFRTETMRACLTNHILARSQVGILQVPDKTKGEDKGISPYTIVCPGVNLAI